MNRINIASKIRLYSRITFPGETEQALEIRRRLNLLFGLDLPVYTPEKLAQRLAWGDSFLQEIIRRGLVLYESTDS